MRFIGLAKRNFIEIMKDLLTLLLGIGLPVFLLILFSIINNAAHGEVENFRITNLIPGIMLFGLVFLLMFSAILISGDRHSSLLNRLKTLPLKTKDFILGYSLPFFLVGLIQLIVCLIVGFCFGLEFKPELFLVMIALLPCEIIFISLGLIMGMYCTDGQISGFGTIFINFCAIFSGCWFDLKLVGGFLQTFAYIFPFANTVDFCRDILYSRPVDWLQYLIVLAHMLVVVIITYFAVKKKIEN